MSGNKATAKKAERKKRVPLGSFRTKLNVSGRQGYKRRWVNDKEGRISQALDGGYQFTPKDGAQFKDKDAATRNESINDAMCKTVDSDGTKAYLMEIPTAYHTADQAEKQKAINEQENAILHGEDGHGKVGIDGRYVPRGGNKIQR